MNKITLGILSLLVAGAIVGSYFFPQNLNKIEQVSGTTSGSGSTQHTATFAFNPTSSSATTSSVQNFDSQDRVVTGPVTVSCSGIGTSKTAFTGAGLANLTFQIASTSALAPAALGNTNYVLNMNFGTSTVDNQIASSTPINSATGNAIRWPSGAYLTISSNATNTAACVVGIPYVQGLGF